MAWGPWHHTKCYGMHIGMKNGTCHHVSWHGLWHYGKGCDKRHGISDGMRHVSRHRSGHYGRSCGLHHDTNDGMRHMSWHGPWHHSRGHGTHHGKGQCHTSRVLA